jgi:hypothetical protein
MPFQPAPSYIQSITLLLMYACTQTLPATGLVGNDVGNINPAPPVVPKVDKSTAPAVFETCMIDPGIDCPTLDNGPKLTVFVAVLVVPNLIATLAIAAVWAKLELTALLELTAKLALTALLELTAKLALKAYEELVAKLALPALIAKEAVVMLEALITNEAVLTYEALTT